MDVRLPDGTLLQNVPDGMSRADLTSKLAANGYDVSKLAPPPQQSMGDQVKNYIYNHAFFGASPQDIANAGAGAVKGASEIGSTLMMPAQWLGIPQTVASGLRYLAGPVDANHHAGVVAQAADALAHGLDPTEGATQTIPGLITGAPAPNIDAARRQEVTQGLQMMGADPNSTAFTLGKMGAEIAGTAGAGKAVTAGIKAVPAVAKLAAPLLPAIESGGFSLGKTGGNWLANALLRATGGAVSGGATAGLINPNTAAQGAEIGAISPLAIGGVGKLGSAAYRNVKGLLQPIINPEATAAKMLAGASGTDAPTLAKVLAQPQELVPGSTPTTAQVIATPQAVAMEKAMRNNPDFAVKYENLMNANNAARLEAVNSVAGAPGDLEAAQAARQATANQLYGQAYGAQPTITPELQSQMDALMQRPAMKSAIQDAKQIALNQGLPLDNASSVQGLHYAKMSLDDQISRALRAGDNNLARSLMDTRSSLLDVLGNLSPDYRQAMATYADMSKPVNTMQVGREMQKNLWNKSLNSASDPALTFNNYRGALDKSLRGAEYGINPDAEATLRSVQNDLQRATVSNSFRTPGSDTAYNLNAQPWLSQKIYGPGFTGSGAKAKAIGTGIGTALGVATGHPLAGAGMGAAAMVGLGKVGTQRVNDALSNMLLNPQEAAKALLALKPTERAALSAAMAQKLGQFNNLPVVLGTQ